MTAIRNSARYPNYTVCSSFKKYCDNLTKMYFSARWLVRADVHNGDTLIPAEVESGFSSKIETIPHKSGRLDTTVNCVLWLSAIQSISNAPHRKGNHIKIFRSLKLPVIGINNSTKVVRLPPGWGGGEYFLVKDYWGCAA